MDLLYSMRFEWTYGTKKSKLSEKCEIATTIKTTCVANSRVNIIGIILNIYICKCVLHTSPKKQCNKSVTETWTQQHQQQQQGGKRRSFRQKKRKKQLNLVWNMIFVRHQKHTYARTLTRLPRDANFKNSKNEHSTTAYQKYKICESFFVVVFFSLPVHLRKS